ncbi:MAG: hypothetical protein LKK08_06925 [Bacteroidales bacterium]|jgi:TonB-dependent SusC/RagA subfamily outer membrane receptor|nr:hypothetical protein [Bacteroidales bacterium]MCI2145961.1 hypothetical protein [Bacteroidales bacterium]
MGAFLIYVAKVAVVLTLFFLFNNLLLSRETFHRFNRIWWLASIAASVVIPSFHFGFPYSHKSVAAAAVPMQTVAGNVTALSVQSSAQHSALPTVVMVFFAIYLAGALTFAALFVLSYIRLHRQCKACELFKRDGINVYVCENEMVPFSWWNNMMISRLDMNTENEAIFDHEFSHIRLHHTLDILLCNFLIVFQWFNPCSWLTKRSLQKVHEYQADEKVLEKGRSLRNYQMLLIRKAVGHRLYSMANSFNHNDLKSRITMMSKSKSSKWAYAKALYVLPLVLLVATAFSTPEVSGKCTEISNVKVSNFQQNDTLKCTSVSYSSDLKAGGDTATLIIRTVNGKTVINAGLYSASKGKPLYIVDGNVVSGSHVLSSIASDSIETITVLKDSAAVSAYGEQGSNGVIKIVTKKITDAKFNGGDSNEFSKWASMNLIYPEAAKKSRQSMRVFVNFKVDGEGSVRDVKTYKYYSRPESSGKPLNEIVVVAYGSDESAQVSEKDKEAADKSLLDEAERVVKSSPKWEPAICDGKPVDEVYSLVIRFELR